MRIIKTTAFREAKCFKTKTMKDLKNVTRDEFKTRKSIKGDK